jgi:sulfatase modifying factor 1
VLVLHHSIIKAISVFGFLALTLGPADRPHLAAVPGVPAASPASPAPLAAGTAIDPASPASPVREEPAAKSAKSAAPSPKGTDTSACPRGMILVDGESCPDAEQVCLKWLDPPPYQNLRCGEYAKPAKCKGPTKHRRFCVDREEYAESEGPDALPLVGKSWGEAKSLCEARGARLCVEAEWEFACEGPEMSPYPYGWKRDSSVCNMDRTDLGGAEDKLRDHRAPLSAFPGCTSPFGAHDMVGNVDEWVEREGATAPHRSALRGGWWLPGRNRCRAATLGHDETYSGKQVGFRCCKDAS